MNSVHRGKKLLNVFPPDITNQLNSIRSQELAENETKRAKIREDSSLLLETILENFLQDGNNIFGCVPRSSHDYQNTFLADLFSPKQTIDGVLNVFIVNAIKFISFPLFPDNQSLDIHKGDSIQNIDLDKYEEENSRVLLTSFTVAITCKEDEKDILNLKEYLHFFAKCLEFEEKMESFVSKQIYKILQANNEFQDIVRDNIKLEKNDNFADSVIAKIKHISNQYFEKFELLKLIKDFYTSMMTKTTFNFICDCKIKRQFNLIPKSIPAINYDEIQPFKTMIIFKKACLAKISVDASPRLLRFIERHDPKLSLLNLALELDLSIDEIMIYSAHIITWGFGKLINVIFKKNRYGPNYKDKDIISKISTTTYDKFQREYSYDIINILNIFSTLLPVSKQREKLNLTEKHFFDLLICMIKQDLLIEYKTYIYLKGEIESLYIYINKLRNNKSDSSNKIADVLEALSHYSFKKKDVNEIAYELGLEPSVIYKAIKQSKNLFDTYFTE